MKTRTVYDLAWDLSSEGESQGVYAKDLLVEAAVRMVVDDSDPFGEHTGTYVLADHALPTGTGVLLLGAATPIFGPEAVRAWDARRAVFEEPA